LKSKSFQEDKKVCTHSLNYLKLFHKIQINFKMQELKAWIVIILKIGHLLIN